MKEILLNKRSVMIFIFSNILLNLGCAFEVENPGKPDTGKPKRTSQEDPQTPEDERQESRATLSTGKPSQTEEPKAECTGTVTYGAVNSSGQNGAVIKLAAHSEGIPQKLFIRNSVSDVFIDASGVVYTNGGEFHPDLYTFEYHTVESKTCYFKLNITESDAAQNLQITLSLMMPTL